MFFLIYFALTIWRRWMTESLQSVHIQELWGSLLHELKSSPVCHTGRLVYFCWLQCRNGFIAFDLDPAWVDGRLKAALCSCKNIQRRTKWEIPRDTVWKSVLTCVNYASIPLGDLYKGYVRVTEICKKHLGAFTAPSTPSLHGFLNRCFRLWYVVTLFHCHLVTGKVQIGGRKIYCQIFKPGIQHVTLTPRTHAWFPHGLKVSCDYVRDNAWQGVHHREFWMTLKLNAGQLLASSQVTPDDEHLEAKS